MLKKLISGITPCKSVVDPYCTLQLLDISVSETGLRFTISLNSLCKGTNLYLHEIPDINIEVCSRTYTDIFKN